MSQRRATRGEAMGYLAAAQAAGHISGFREQEGRWLIEVPPTRYDAYQVTENPAYPFVPPTSETHGVIGLTHREVYAFTEGLWAGAGRNPVARAGADR